MSQAALGRKGSPGWVLGAFGLSIRSELELFGAARGAPPGGRPVQLVRISSEELRDPSLSRGVAMLERHFVDGSLGMRVTRLDGGGYRIDAPGAGTFVIGHDGSQLWCGELEGPRWQWHRPLYAQALPLTATLSGLEPLHASGVQLGGKALAFVAASGTGKTSLAVHLAARGAALLADDVVAVESLDGEVVAHPGVPTANVAEEQIALLSAAQRARLGRLITTSDKIQMVLRSRPLEPVALGGVFFLERSQAIREVVLERATAPDPRELLAATFMPHVMESNRLRAQLQLCGEIAESVPVFHLRAPVNVGAAKLAETIERMVATAEVS